MVLERKISRRGLFVLTGSYLVSSACDSLQGKEQSAFPDMREKRPLSGDVVSIGSKNYLLRDNFAYEIPDIEKYKKFTKFNKYKRRTFNVSTIPSGYEIKRFTKENEGGLVDLYTGDWKDGKIYGGEINVFFPGFLTDGGKLFDVINPKNETFYDIREKGLKKNNWDLLDNFFFTYGSDKLEGYKVSDTIVNPEINIKKALEFFNYLKKEFPLCQFNLIGHSLGGLFAMEVAKQNPDCINNLILIDSPVNGIKKNESSEGKARVLKNSIRPIVGEEYVTDYLFTRWDKNYRTELDKFSKYFMGSGGRMTVIASEPDLIAPLESKLINGVRQEILKGSFDSPLMGYLYYHGASLKNERIIMELIIDIIGENETRDF